MIPIALMDRLRTVFFGSGSPASQVALRYLFDAAQVVGVVVPEKHGSATRPLRQAALEHELPIIEFSDVAQLRSLEADLFCVATFPRLFGANLLSLPRLGILNVHASLLPKHRGPDPIFWAYFENEAETGVTVHWMSEKVDAGDIVLQSRIAIPRGSSGATLYMQLAEIGARLLVDAVRRISNGTATRTPQDERMATSDPTPSKMTWSIPYTEWHAERLWHFLRGTEHLGLFRRGGYVEEYEIVKHDRTPGETIREGSRLTIYTGDGRVRLSVPTRTGRWIRRVMSRLRVR